MSASDTAVIVLAAGAGSRMQSAKPKVLHEVCGRSLLWYALTAASAIEPARVLVVVADQTMAAHATEIAPYAEVLIEETPTGTAAGLRLALAELADIATVVVMPADLPLLTGAALGDLLAEHGAGHNAATVLTAVVDDPQGFDRIDRDGPQVRIVADPQATTLDHREVSSGVFAFAAEPLREAPLEADVTQVAIAISATGRLGAHLVNDRWLITGVDDRVQLAQAAKELNSRILEHWMRAGVTIVDPATTWVEESVDLARDVTLLPNTMLAGATTVAEGATIGPDSMLTDVEVGAGATVTRCQGSLAVIGANATVGPYSYLRPGTELGDSGKIGGFVETKNAKIGAGAKVPHLTYCGDAEVGAGSNIGAGVIFANYDGVTKSHTQVGSKSFVGSNSVLVAPVSIADGSYVAAGSAITDSVGPGDLGIARGRQRNVEGWVASRRADATDDAAVQTPNSGRKKSTGE